MQYIHLENVLYNQGNYNFDAFAIWPQFLKEPMSCAYCFEIWHSGYLCIRPFEDTRCFRLGTSSYTASILTPLPVNKNN